jgi:hypothetical protein
MSFNPLSDRWRISIAMLSIVLILNLAVCAQSVQAAFANDTESGGAPIMMIFHMHSSVYSNSASIFIYNGADTNPPIYSTPATTSVSCTSSSGDFQQFLPSNAQTWLSGGNVWMGGVAWITQPLGQDLTIRGNASITVWMSSSDADVAESGYLLGMAESTSMVNIVGEPMYQYYQTSGSFLQPPPSLYRLTFGVDRTFAKGNIIAFFVIVGSTSRGWQVQVYFDSPQMNSFAELPLDGAPVPEFSQLGTVACMALAMLCSGIIYRRERQAR